MNNFDVFEYLLLCSFFVIRRQIFDKFSRSSDLLGSREWRKTRLKYRDIFGVVCAKLLRCFLHWNSIFLISGCSGFFVICVVEWILGFGDNKMTSFRSRRQRSEKVQWVKSQDYLLKISNTNHHGERKQLDSCEAMAQKSKCFRGCQIYKTLSPGFLYLSWSQLFGCQRKSSEINLFLWEPNKPLRS